MNYRRAFVPNGYLHIIITSYDRKPIFIENSDILRTAFKNTKTIYEFEIIAICVLPNHIHLILHPNNIEQYPQIISSIKHYFSRNVGQVCPTDNLKIGFIAFLNKSIFCIKISCLSNVTTVIKNNLSPEFARKTLVFP